MYGNYSRPSVRPYDLIFYTIRKRLHSILRLKFELTHTHTHTMNWNEIYDMRVPSCVRREHCSCRIWFNISIYLYIFSFAFFASLLSVAFFAFLFFSSHVILPRPVQFSRQMFSARMLAILWPTQLNNSSEIYRFGETVSVCILSVSKHIAHFHESQLYWQQCWQMANQQNESVADGCGANWKPIKRICSGNIHCSAFYTLSPSLSPSFSIEIMFEKCF